MGKLDLGKQAGRKHSVVRNHGARLDSAGAAVHLMPCKVEYALNKRSPLSVVSTLR